MNKKQYIGLIMLAVVFFGVMFYWYSLRPSIIRQECYRQATEVASGHTRKFYSDSYNFFYKMCLEKRGL